MKYVLVAFIPISRLLSSAELALLAEYGDLTFGNCAHSLVSAQVLGAKIDNLNMTGLNLKNAFRALEKLEPKTLIDLES